MKAIRFHEYGDINVLRYEEAQQPRPGPGEAARCRRGDGVQPGGQVVPGRSHGRDMPLSFPHTLGLDLAGTVVDHGPGIEDPAIGAGVIGFLPMTGPGAGAEYVTAAAELLVLAPATIALTDAAAIPVPALTAWQALFEHGNLVAGQRVLVNGAGGGVGGFVVQLAKRAGAQVIATASPRSVDEYAPQEPTTSSTTPQPRSPTHRCTRRSRDQSGRRHRRGHRRPARHHRAGRNPGVGDLTGWGISRTGPSGWRSSACAATRHS